MDIQDDGSAVCSQCGKKIEPLADIEPIDGLESICQEWHNLTTK